MTLFQPNVKVKVWGISWSSINLGIGLGPLIGLSLIEHISFAAVSAILTACVVLGYIFCFFIPLANKPLSTASVEKRKSSA